MREIRRTLTTVCVALSLFLQPLTGNAAVEGAVAQGIATALAGKTVSDIINEVRLSGVSLIDQATHSGNALIARGGNEVSVLSKNLDFIFKDDLNLTFDKLSEERRAVLIEAEAIRRDLARTTDSAYNFKDTAVLDLNSIATALPFVKKTFFVQSVRGLSYLPQAGDFRIQVIASTLGVDEDTSTTVQVYRGQGSEKKLIPEVTVDQSIQRFMADIVIPNKLLADDFRDDELHLLPLTLSFDVSRKTGWWIFSSTNTSSYEVPIYVNLFPKKTASVVAVTKVPVYDWVNIGTKSDRYSTPNRHCKKNCKGEPTRGGNRIEFAVAGGPAPFKVGYQKLVNPRQACIGGNCGWSDSFNLRLTEYDTRLIFTWDTWSTPGTWEATADIHEYRVVNEDVKSSDSQAVYFGRVLELSIPTHATFAVLRVKTFTKQEYEIVLGETDPNGILTYQGRSPAAPGLTRVAYRVNDPAAVAISRYY